MSIHIQIELPQPDDPAPEWFATMKLIAGSELEVLAQRAYTAAGPCGPDYVHSWLMDQLSDALRGDGLCDPFQPSQLRREHATDPSPSRTQPPALPGQEQLFPSSTRQD